MSRRLLLVACVLWCVVVLVGANTPAKEHHSDTTTASQPMHNDTLHLDGAHVLNEGEEAGGGKIERYPVAVIDFERVQTPFIIGLWIFLACLGKIGKLQSLFL